MQWPIYSRVLKDSPTSIPLLAAAVSIAFRDKPVDTEKSFLLLVVLAGLPVVENVARGPAEWHIG